MSDATLGVMRADLMPVSDARRFRDALGTFPTGVIVLTGQTDIGVRIGMTISSFNSVSLEPPLVLFSIARTAHSLSDVLQLQHYGINILRVDQRPVSTQFSKALQDKWTGVQVRSGRTGCMLLADSLASFECVPYATYDGGDHIIFVGEVVEFESDSADAPLVFFRGRYAQVVS